MQTIKRFCSIQFPPSFLGRLLLSLSLIQAIIIISIEAYVGSIINPRIDVDNLADPNRGLPVYIFIFVISQAWTVLLAWDAIVKQNTIQLICFIAFNLCTFAYSLFQLFQLKFDNIQTIASSTRPFLIAIPCLLGLFTLSFAYMVYKLYLEFGWNIYKKIGADPQMRNMFRVYQIFLTVLKVGFFFWVSFSLQYVTLVLEKYDVEFGFTIAAIPVTLLILFLAVSGLRRENKKIMFSFFVGLVLGFSYFVFKIVRIWSSGRDRLSHTQIFLTFFASLSLLSLIITGVISVLCYRNFGKGLKEHVHVKETTLGKSNNDPQVQPRPSLR